jgi:hypothetical protein
MPRWTDVGDGLWANVAWFIGPRKYVLTAPGEFPPVYVLDGTFESIHVPATSIELLSGPQLKKIQRLALREARAARGLAKGPQKVSAGGQR